MKCVKIKGVREFEIAEINEPVPTQGKILIDVKKSGICGSDLHYFVNGGPVGMVMGHEFCGEVIDNGGNSSFNVGDRVTALPISPCGKCEACLNGNIHFCTATWNEAIGLTVENPGGLTKKILVRDDMVLKVPDGMSDDEGALVEPMAVCYHAVKLANIKIGAKVLVVGGGIIGLGSAMFAKLEGAGKVVVSETNELRGKRAVELGVADEWVDAKDQEKMSSIVNTFDVVIECCGNSPAVNSALMLCKAGGTVILVGVSTAPISFTSSLAVLKELHVIGAICYTKEEFAKCIELIADKSINPMKFVSKTVYLDDVQAAYDELVDGKTETVKILVNPER